MKDFKHFFTVSEIVLKVLRGFVTVLGIVGVSWLIAYIITIT